MIGRKLLIAGTALLWGSSAFAVSPIASCSVSAVSPGFTPSCLILAAPPAVAGADAFQDDYFRLWVEQTNYTLTSPLLVNWDAGTNPIPVGTKIASVGIEFDSAPARVIEGEVTFTRKIIGVIWTTNLLKASDYLSPTTTFINAGRRGLEMGDIADTFIASNGFTFMWRTSSPGDNIRVILSAVPEPATWAMLIAGFGMVGFAARRRRGAVAA